jgi:hypothetical protein
MGARATFRGWWRSAAAAVWIADAIHNAAPKSIRTVFPILSPLVAFRFYGALRRAEET